VSHLTDRVVVITGAASGFGRVLARRCASLGACVVAGDIVPESLDRTVEEITSSGGRAVAARGDVRVRSDMDRLAATAVAAFGSLDVMVNNAGTMPLAFFADHAVAAAAWDQCIDVNFRGVLNGISAVYDQMIGQGRGHVVVISSIYGNHAVPGSAVYSATKAAVNILADTLRQESQGKIKVTVVRPTGVLGTGLAATVSNPAAGSGIVGVNQAAFTEAVNHYLRGDLPPRQGDPDDIEYWAITPEDLVDHIVYAIDQPWGISIGDITVRASGEHYLL
jgi:NADP-dependent 3-hydroxy acid dehydrogenase YdfG